ncbi:hypothetical protein [Macrococcus bovicus]|uniref:hypothetical protein n=1 Tax=Macrococcus bovicus TaxID=69968 RepID=UPI0025A5B61F|nr:hypothetical protein [Macrococcus bovicus]WJP97110.1 hypothetical protein QSV55_07435 [Macrococcus bovicus]
MDLKLILSIVATSVPGFTSYWFLSQFRLFDIGDDNKDEKVILLSSLSVLNIFFGYLACGVFGVEVLKFTNINLICIFLISMGVTLLMSMIVYPSLILISKKTIKKLKELFMLPTDNNSKILDNIMMNRPKDKYDTQAYIFDFDNHLIIEGGIGFISHRFPQLSIRNEIDISTTYEQAIKVYQTTDNLSREIFIDYDKKIKVILIHY